MQKGVGHKKAPVRKKIFVMEMEVQKRADRQLDNPVLVDCLARLLPEKADPEVEVEARFGKIVDKMTGKRLALRAAHCCILEKTDSLRFEARMQYGDFVKMQRCMEEGGAEGKREKMVDSVIKGVRETRFIGEGARDPVYVEKRKLWHLDIYCPQNKYDVRVSLSREKPVDKGAASQFQGSWPMFSRKKDRTMYKIGEVSVDFTAVRTEGDGEKRPGDRGHGEKRREEEVQYELEIEASSEGYERASFIRKMGNLMELFEERLREK